MSNENPPWQTTPPATAGPWLVRCHESDFKPHLMTVCNREGGLWVEDGLLGPYPVQRYHDELTRAEWHKQPDEP